MKTKKRRKAGYLTQFILALTLFYSCASSPLLTENLAENAHQKDILKTHSDRDPNVLYTENLSDFSPPSDADLFREGGFKNKKIYNQSVSMLADWILKKLPSKQRVQLAQNCENLVDKNATVFPLNAQTLACAAWWLEERSLGLRLGSRKPSASSETIKILTSKEKKNWVNYRGMPFSKAFAQMTDVNSKIDAQRALAQSERFAGKCQYMGAQSALLFRLEALLPDEQAITGIEKVYARVQKCLVPDSDAAERVHQRYGLFSLLLGHEARAKRALERALQDSDPQESSRTLFWLGILYHKNQSDKKTNPYWQRLIKEQPLSFAAIVAATQMGKDPKDSFVPDSAITVQDREPAGWTEHNMEAFVFDVLRAQKKTAAAVQWGKFVVGTTTLKNADMLLYWAIGQNAVGNSSASIFMMGRYTRYKKNYAVSDGLLRLQFPQPYFKEITSAAKAESLDPLFVFSLIRQESAFDSFARSGPNARGLMQVLPSTAKTIQKGVTADALFDPRTNLAIGSAYLVRLLKKYDGKIEYVLAAYNAGGGRLEEWLPRVSNQNMMLFSDFIPFRETRNYISIILRNYYWYGRILSEKNDAAAKKIKALSETAVWKSPRVFGLLANSWQIKLNKEEKSSFEDLYVFGKKEMFLVK